MDIINLFFYYIIRRPILKIWRFLSDYNLNLAIEVNRLPQIDVVMCVISKDLPILPISIDGVRRFCLNPIKDFFIIAPNNSQIIDFCNENNLTFIDELSVYNKEKFNTKQFKFKGENRTGWIYQQILKLSFNYGTCENYLVIDADHVLVKPHLFVNDKGIPFFYMSDEFNLSYYITNYKILKVKPYFFSFISHKCVFNKHVLNELSKEITLGKKGADWVLILLNHVSFDLSGSPFSEYEFYGSYFKRKYNCVLKPWHNLNIRRSDVDQKGFLEKGNYHTYTYPSYMD